MAATGRSLAERVSRWDTLVSNLEPTLGDLPHVASFVAQLKEKLNQARDLGHLQDTLRAQAQDNNVTLAELARQGDKLRSRIATGLYGKYGYSSEMLLQFGFRPRRPPVRRKKGEEASAKAPATVNEP